MNNYNNNPLPPSQSCPSFGLWLALSIACTLLANKLCGIIAIVYIVFANTAYMQGNYTDRCYSRHYQNYIPSLLRNGKHTFPLIRQGVIQELLNRSLFL